MSSGPVIDRVNPDTMHRPSGYTHVVIATGGKSVFIAGQVALDTDGNLIGEGDVAAQAEQVFTNLTAALAAVGGTFANVVKITVFLTDMSHITTVRDIRNRYVDTANPPASTAVEVVALARPEWLIEVEAIAVVAA
ncbi:MAG: RidA family protein [Dehalococcoidia bacterium]